jgi:hypothetical protein
LRGKSGIAGGRDVSVVELVGDAAAGAADPAAALRATWQLPSQRFTVLLVGKDGHEALRRSAPVTAADLARTIDAMPMRRAGQR